MLRRTSLLLGQAQGVGEDKRLVPEVDVRSSHLASAAALMSSREN